jgi:hypothetical protein
MKATLQADGQVVVMKPFVEEFIARVAHAVIQSLKGTQGANKAVFLIRGKNLELQVNGQVLDLHIDRGFAEVIARDTIMGALSHLRGLRGKNEIRLELEI